MSKKCLLCQKAIYPMDPQLNLDGRLFHKSCAKCADCACQITVSNFAKSESGDEITLLCKTHYFKRFHEGGAYLGGDKYEKKAPRDALKEGTAAAALSPVKTVGEPKGENDFPGKVAEVGSSASNDLPEFAKRRASLKPTGALDAVADTTAPTSAPPPVPSDAPVEESTSSPAAEETVFNTETIVAATEEAAAAELEPDNV